MIAAAKFDRFLVVIFLLLDFSKAWLEFALKCYSTLMDSGSMIAIIEFPE